MIFKVFSVYDSKVEAYLPPLFMKSRGEFLRAFSEAVSDPKSNIGKYPGDYTAFEIGSWDDCKCFFDLYSTPQSLGVGVEFVKDSGKSG